MLEHDQNHILFSLEWLYEPQKKFYQKSNFLKEFLKGGFRALKEFLKKIWFFLTFNKNFSEAHIIILVLTKCDFGHVLTIFNFILRISIEYKKP